MTIFFLMVGLEIERELYDGELNPIKNAILPIGAAIGGMLIPALLYVGINYGKETTNGFGIPMGTDIAFALGILSLAGNKVPLSLKILLTAIAIIDDLGSIIIIALFYGSNIQLGFLAASLSIFVFLILLNRLKVYSSIPYLVLGIPMWYCMMRSGIHPTISGVLLAFALPFGSASGRSPSIHLQHHLHFPVAFIILPIFTLANTAIPIHANFLSSLFDPHALGIGLGLLVGKPLGIFFASFALIKLKVVQLPNGVVWYDIFALGCIAGIGFTMSIFITQLAFTEEVLIQSSKLMILIASAIAGCTGLLFFKMKKF
jgi:NhaA family Na+:H+ antiporter